MEREVARAELYLADEVFLTGTAAEVVPVREIDDHVVGGGEPGPITASSSASTTTPFTGAIRATREWLDLVEMPSGSRPGPRVRLTRPMSRIETYDTTLRDGMQGEGMSLSAEEKLRVAHRLDELGIDVIEAGFPSSNPKELELFELLAQRALRHAADRRVRDDAQAGHRGRRRPGAARPCGLLRAGLHAGRQELGAAPGQGRQGRPRREPEDDRRIGRLPRAGRTSA